MRGLFLLLPVCLACAFPSGGFGQNITYPRDQIALQLGAIQLGYTSPLLLSAVQPQQAIDAVAQGRLSLGSANGLSAVNVLGATNLPANVDAFRQQIDQAVEAVLAAPATARLRGVAALSNGKTSKVTSALKPPSSDWTIPLPFALDAKYSAQGGPMGPEGPRGDKGDKGDGGDVGAQGPIGLTGPVGAKGDTGVQGSTGLTGAKGDKGDPGEQGPIGLTGPQGEAGPKGEKGDPGEQGLQGLVGAEGSQGPTGDTGAQGPTGAKGDKGDLGEQGPQGLIGPEGPQGDIGVQGPIGLKGDTGLQGPTGPKGDQGEQGLPGVQGLKGDTGDAGPKGDKGDVGAQGLKGNTGLVGPKGDQGDDGPQGPTGSQGLQGAQGTAGLQGATGPAGPAGPQGEQGPAGPNGPIGPQGGTGPQGSTGATGATGAAGAKGDQGLTGPQGDVGPKGDTGDPAQFNGVLYRPYVSGEPTMATGMAGINYQGVLTNSQGTLVSGTQTFAIKLFNAATGGTELYSESVGSINVANGVYSFEFGTTGTSNTQQSETVAVTDGTASTFQKVLSATNVVAGSVSVTDGTYTWSQAGGSSNEDAFGAAYSSSLRRVTVTYYNGAPSAGRTITATYRTPTGGISGALAGNNQPWSEVTVGGVAQVPRQKVLTVPFATRAAIAESVQSSTSERTFVVNLWNDGGRGLGKTFASRNSNVQVGEKAFLESYLDVIPFGGVLKSIKANVYDTSTGANSSTVFLRVYKVADSNALVQVASSESGNEFNGGSVQLTVDLQALSLAKTKPSSFLVSIQSNGTSGDITYFPNGDLRVDSVEVTFSVTD